MTATPIAMVEHFQHNLHDAKFVIQWHVVAMFAPSFFTGSLILRIGIKNGEYFLNYFYFWIGLFLGDGEKS